MVKHNMRDHPEEEVTFRMKVLAKHRSAFERQVTEAVLMEMKEKDKLLNSKEGGRGTDEGQLQLSQHLKRQ